MATPQGCPCDAVKQLTETLKDLSKIVDAQGKRLNEGDTSFALIQKDLEIIKTAVNQKEKFDASIISSVVNGIVTILLGYIAVRMGLQ